MAIEFPGRLDRLLTQLEQGELVLRAAEQATGRAVHALHVITNRIVQAIAIATLLLALVLILITMRRENSGDAISPRRLLRRGRRRGVVDDLVRHLLLAVAPSVMRKGFRLRQGRLLRGRFVLRKYLRFLFSALLSHQAA